MWICGEYTITVGCRLFYLIIKIVRTGQVHRSSINGNLLRFESCLREIVERD